MKKTLKILIADDHKLIRNGVKLMLENQNEFVAQTTEATNCREIFSSLKSIDFDVVLLDISMPDINGLDALKEIKKINPFLPVLMLTMHNEENIIKKAVELGASGYILKSAEIDELVKAINSIMNDIPYFSNEVYQVLLNEKRKGQAKITENKIPLTAREKQVLSMIIKEMTNQEIAETLFLSKRTVEGHRKKIMEKLEIKTTIGLVKYAIQNGIE